MGHEVEVPMVKVPGSAGEWVDQETGFPSKKKKPAFIPLPSKKTQNITTFFFPEMNNFVSPEAKLSLCPYYFKSFVCDQESEIKWFFPEVVSQTVLRQHFRANKCFSINNNEFYKS